MNGLLVGHFAFYVVWSGKKPGIYSSWRACQEQVLGFKNASYKGYYTFNDAMDAFQNKEDHPVSTVMFSFLPLLFLSFLFIYLKNLANKTYPSENCILF